MIINFKIRLEALSCFMAYKICDNNDYLVFKLLIYYNICIKILIKSINLPCTF